MADQKLCVDCKWIDRGWFAKLFTSKEFSAYRCNNPKTLPDPDADQLVTGVLKRPFCTIARKCGKCGMDGRLFESAKDDPEAV